MLTLLGRDRQVCLHRLDNFTFLFGILRFEGLLLLHVWLIFRLPPVAFLSCGAHVGSRGGWRGCLIVFFSILIDLSVSNCGALRLGLRADSSGLELLLLLLLNLRIRLLHGVRLFRDFVLFDGFLDSRWWRCLRDITLARLVLILFRRLLGLWRLRWFLLLFFLGLSR